MHAPGRPRPGRSRRKRRTPPQTLPASPRQPSITQLLPCTSSVPRKAPEKEPGCDPAALLESCSCCASSGWKKNKHPENTMLVFASQHLHQGAGDKPHLLQVRSCSPAQRSPGPTARRHQQGQQAAPSNPIPSSGSTQNSVFHAH